MSKLAAANQNFAQLVPLRTVSPSAVRLPPLLHLSAFFFFTRPEVSPQSGDVVFHDGTHRATCRRNACEACSAFGVAV